MVSSDHEKSSAGRPAIGQYWMTAIQRSFLAGAVSSLVLFAGTAMAQMGYHQHRHIHVNGTHLNDNQIQELDTTLGYKVPSGFYWMDGQKGVWGYEGNKEVLGSIFHAKDPRRNASNRNQPQRQQGNRRSQRPYISNDTGTGSAVINPNKGGCSYVSAGGTTVRVCD